MVKRLLAAGLILGAAQGCALITDGGERVYMELHAPQSFRAEGEPYRVGEWDPWSVTRAEGCLYPGDVAVLETQQKGPSLMVSIPSASLTLGADAPRLTGGDDVMVSGAGAEGDPFIVRWAELDRWRAFLADWEAYPQTREDGGVRQAYLEFEADAEALKAIPDAGALNALLAGRPTLKANYYVYLDRFNGPDNMDRDACAG